MPHDDGRFKADSETGSLSLKTHTQTAAPAPQTGKSATCRWGPKSCCNNGASTPGSGTLGMILGLRLHLVLARPHIKWQVILWSSGFAGLCWC